MRDKHGHSVVEIPATLDWTDRQARRARSALVSRGSLGESLQVIGDGFRLAAIRGRARGIPSGAQTTVAVVALTNADTSDVTSLVLDRPLSPSRH